MQCGICLIGNGQVFVYKYWEELLEKIKMGEFDLVQMILYCVCFEDLDKVYYKFDNKEDGMQKVFVEIKFLYLWVVGMLELIKYQFVF